MSRIKILLLLYVTILCSAGSLFAQTTQWTFNNSASGWLPGSGLNGTVDTAGYHLTITDIGPYLNSPANLNMDATAFGQFYVRLQNSGSAMQFQVFWITNDDHVWNQSKSAYYRVNAYDTGQADYQITLLGNTQWSNTIEQVRLGFGLDGLGEHIQISKVGFNPLEFGLSDSTLHVRLDLSRGGAISYISKADTNFSIVNISDEGRYVQQSYYAGKPVNRQAEGQSPSWSPWPWNPIQVGDSHKNRAQIITYQIGADTLYSKCIPMLWDMNNMPAEAYMEQWTMLSGNVIHVYNKLTCHRTDTLYGGGIPDEQELPAVYPISALNNLYSYFDSLPFTNAPYNNPPVVNLSSGFWGIYDTVTEHWMAFVNDNMWGMGVYNPLCTNFLAGMSGTAGGNSTSGSTCYIAPVLKVPLDSNSIFEYDYYLVVGTLNEIRANIYQIVADTAQASSIPALSQNEGVLIYPNPANGMVTIRLQNAEETMVNVDLLNIDGQLIYTGKIRSSGYELNLGSYSKGLYFIRITDNQHTIIRKLIVE